METPDKRNKNDQRARKHKPRGKIERRLTFCGEKRKTPSNIFEGMKTVVNYGRNYCKKEGYYLFSMGQIKNNQSDTCYAMSCLKI